MTHDSMKLILVAAVFLVVGWALSRLWLPAPRDTNERLVVTTERAVRSALDANEDAAAYRDAVDKFYFLALAGAAIIPLVLAGLLLRTWANAPPEPAEVFREMENALTASRPALPHPETKALTERPMLPAQSSDEDDGAAKDRE